MNFRLLSRSFLCAHKLTTLVTSRRRRRLIRKGRVIRSFCRKGIEVNVKESVVSALLPSGLFRASSVTTTTKPTTHARRRGHGTLLQLLLVLLNLLIDPIEKLKRIRHRRGTGMASNRCPLITRCELKLAEAPKLIQGQYIQCKRSIKDTAKHPLILLLTSNEIGAAWNGVDPNRSWLSMIFPAPPLFNAGGGCWGGPPLLLCVLLFGGGATETDKSTVRIGTHALDQSTYAREQERSHCCCCCPRTHW